MNKFKYFLTEFLKFDWSPQNDLTKTKKYAYGVKFYQTARLFKMPDDCKFDANRTEHLWSERQD